MFEPLSQLLIRTPLLSLRNAYHDSGETSELLLEGIYLSSPSLYNELQRKTTISQKDRERAELAFSKYHLRSCTRCTPYGTFAGCGLLEINDGQTKIVLGELDLYQRKIRIDMNYITEIINMLLTLPGIRSQIRFFTNNSLYELSDSFRYVEYSIKNNIRSYELSSIRKTKYLKEILTTARKGVTLGILTRLLMDSENVTEPEAAAFIEEIYASQLLIAELEPCMTGIEPLDGLIGQLEKLTGIDGIINQLKLIQTLINKPGKGVDTYKQIEQALKGLNLLEDIPKDTLQTDLFIYTKEKTVDKAIIDIVSKQAEELLVFGELNKNTNLEDFKKRFIEKYDHRYVGLSQVLDTEMGIGYADIGQSASGVNELINDLFLPMSEQQSMVRNDQLQQFVLRKYRDFLENKKEVIEINEDELMSIGNRDGAHNFPANYSLIGSLLKVDGKLDAGHFEFDLVNLAGQSVSKLLARFAHGDKGICSLTEQLLKEEENESPDVIFAEIVHLPQARISNIMLRPFISEYEISYVGKSGAMDWHQIPISDILVGIHQDQVILRSKKLNKRVIPRLTNAHNFTLQALPVYRFFGELQFQGFSNVRPWNWGILSSINHLPRVNYKNLILKKAQWTIKETDLPDLPANKTEHIRYFKTFRAIHRIPSRVVYIDHDNKLLIDFEEARGIELFLHYLGKRKSIELEEFLFNEENCIVRDSDGLPYTNELIIPLKLRPLAVINDVKQTSQNRSVKRTFSLNSEWLYFKIYCGPSTGEEILKAVIFKFIKKQYKKGLFEKFFFIRYHDPSNHIRIRFYNSDVSKQMILQKSFMDCLGSFLTDAKIEKVMLDTYSREIERYGADIMEESETIFFNDSMAVLHFISLLEGNAFEKYRMIFAIRNIDMLLEDFKLTIPEKCALLKQISTGFFKEFGGSIHLQKQLNDKYRREQQFIFTHMNKNNDQVNEIVEAVALFEKRSEMNRAVIAEIKSKRGSDLSTLLSSYIHMSMNRLFINHQRRYELVVYHFMERYYTSQHAMISKRG